jgi:hypothetical protein
MLKKASIYFLILIGFLPTELFGQNEAITTPQLFYRKRTQFGMNLNSTGLGGINFKYGWHKTGRIKNMLDFEFARQRHMKETRIYGQAIDNPRQYTYGRLNMAFFLRTGYGQNIAITERPYKNAISLHFNYAVGINTAILKPIYLDIIQPVDKSRLGGYQLVAERYDPNIHTVQDKIFGNSSFTYGLDELAFYPGLYARSSLGVEWGPYPDEFHALEAGVVIDGFPKPLPLMAYQPKDYYFITLFIQYTFGFNK